MENATTQTQPTTAINRKDLHQQVTDIIIQQLEAGTVPWEQPWAGGNSHLPGIPKNFTTGNHYRGINILLLWASAISNDYKTSEWASFKQWSNQKESIRKGEKGSLIVYYDTIEREIDGEIKNIPFLKSSIVFNRCQLGSYQPEEPKLSVEYTPLFNRIKNAERFVSETGASIEHGGTQACYLRNADRILLPEPEAFLDTEACTAIENYYSTLLHEIIHWSGSPDRLNRTKGKRFGDEDYATEELVAELGAAFLCADLQISAEPKKNHSRYIAGWLKAIKENKHCIFAAASEATKAVDYLHKLQTPI